MRFLLLLAFVSLLYSQPSQLPKPAPNTDTWIPVYVPVQEARKISFLPPQPIVSSGKIYTLGNYLLQIEKDSGIHVIDYSDRTLPQKIGFIKSLFCSEMAIKGQNLYINNLDDLVVLNISNITSPFEVTRIPHTFEWPSGEYPNGMGFFECPDPSKGVVVGWKREKRDYPKCYR